MEGVRIPWCMGVVNELAQSGRKDRRSQNGFGIHHCLKG